MTSNHSVFTQELLSWYNQHRRDLPWRDTKDPYRIWLSEIILQQTRVAQGLPYYRRFLEAYPALQNLAEAPLQEVLRLWQGLGYYSRARNLHRCARTIVNDFGGQFPKEYGQLLTLPGIGDYTASAIASFAFGQREPVVDGNVFRVISRVFGIESDIAKPATRRQFKELGRQLISEEHPDKFNQAIMEFGALQCTPRQPACHLCPFHASCYAYQNKIVHQLPRKSKRTTTRSRYFNYYLVRYQDRILMKERTTKDIWQGLFDFLLLESGQHQSPLNGLETCMPDASLMHETAVMEPSDTYRHKLTHQDIYARFTEVKLQNAAQLKSWMEAFELEEFHLQEIAQLPKPILIDKYLKAVIF